MIAKDFQGYKEGRDITKIPVSNLSYPSKNVIVSKNKITTRGGLVNDGVASTGNNPIHSEFVWKDALGGVRPIRCTGQKVQVKFESKWYTIFESLDSEVTRVFFATWVDNNGALVKKRLFFVDGSANMYQWNGAIAKVESYASDVITIAGTKTLAQEGFDTGATTYTNTVASDTQFDITNPAGDTFRYTWDTAGTDPSIDEDTFPIGATVIVNGANFNAGNKGTFIITGVGANYFEVENASGVAETDKTVAGGSIAVHVATSVRVFSLDGNGDVDDTSDYTYTNNPTTGQDITLDNTPDPVPVEDDIVVQMPTVFQSVISDEYLMDAIHSYQNHIIVANFNSVELFWSHLSDYSNKTGLNYVMPASNSRTALTAIYMRLDGNFTAITSRKNILWISDADDWYKATKTIEQNPYDLWVDVEKFETGERKGALPMATAKHKGDIIYVAQDKTLQRVTSVEVLGTDEIRQISDDVEALFNRVDLDDVRVYYVERAIYLICPQDSTLIILDLIEGYFQPPQIIPINCMSVIEGVKYGHHNAVDETYVLFSGRNDLGTPIEAKIAFGYQSGKHGFRYKQHTMFGVSCRLTGDTEVLVDEYFEEDGAKTTTNFEIVGANVKTYSIDDDVSWATHPYAERSWGGADMESVELKRAMVFDKFDAVAYFDFRPIFTISGLDNEFHLLGWFIDDSIAKRKIGNDLFISK